MTSAKGIGIPIKLMHEAEGHMITVGRYQNQPIVVSLYCILPENIWWYFRRKVSTSCQYQVELKSGESYRGELAEAEDNWNCQLKNVRATARVIFVAT